MKFSAYPIIPAIKQNLEELGFKKPTDIQYKSIPPILDREDVLAIAQTGTGKTAAFSVPVIHRLAKTAGKKQGVRCLVMVPTRELALQIKKAIDSFSKGTGIKATAIVGGMEQDPQIAQLNAKTDIVVATPGRLFDLSAQGHLQLDQVEVLILDEADHMLDLGFIKDIRDLVRKLPRNRQTLFFSATIDEEIKKLAYSLVKNAIRIQVSPKNPVAKNIKHGVVFVEMDDKRFFLERLIKEDPEKKTLVFVRTQVRAERVAKAMERVQIKAETIHGGKEQKDRTEVLERFTNGLNRLLIATDVSARGIDVPGVEQVVNYDMPDRPENYVHRVGRTGRGREKGWAISFCSEQEKELLKAIEAYTGSPIAVQEMSATDYEQTLDFSEDQAADWKTLIRENEKQLSVKKSARKKRRK